jgi:hypothetical protein
VYYKARVYKNMFRRLKTLLQKRKKDFANYCNIRALFHRSLLIKVFGVWVISSAKSIDIGRKCNKIICKRFRLIIYYAFFAWGRLYQRSIYIRQGEKEKLLLYTQELNQKLSLLKDQTERKKRVQIIRNWARNIRLKKAGRVLEKILLGNFSIRLLYLAFRNWQYVNNLAIIVTYLQKYWRGYRIRFIKRKKLRDYLKWFRNSMKILIPFRDRSIKKRSIFKWRRYLSYHKEVAKVKDNFIYKKFGFKKWIAFHDNISHQLSKFWKLGGLYGVFGMPFRVKRSIKKIKYLKNNGKYYTYHKKTTTKFSFT